MTQVLVVPAFQQANVLNTQEHPTLVTVQEETTFNVVSTFTAVAKVFAEKTEIVQVLKYQVNAREIMISNAARMFHVIQVKEPACGQVAQVLPNQVYAPVQMVSNAAQVAHQIQNQLPKEVVLKLYLQLERW